MGHNDTDIQKAFWQFFFVVGLKTFIYTGISDGFTIFFFTSKFYGRSFDVSIMLFVTPFSLNYTEQRHALLVKIASVREVVLGAPIRIILKHLASRRVAPDVDRLVALVHRPNESFFLVPQVHTSFFNISFSLL